MTKMLGFIILLASLGTFSQTGYFNYKKGNDNYYNSLTFMVNGIKLETADKSYKINLNRDLDTVCVHNKATGKSYTVLTKFRNKRSYDFSPNACSTFEIIPRQRSQKSNFIRLISQNKNGTVLFLNSAHCFIDTKQIQNKDTTDYYLNHVSGYCPFAVSSFNMCTTDGTETNHNPKECVGQVLYCNGGQMYSLYYDYAANKMTVRFDGYYHKKQKIKTDKTKD